ncbi:MAG: hypothetical protein C7B44_14745 [Sulfobacillus thermosulfidooxidans]|nr:hypothetical protein [Sulfobacillus thermotolerans]PSR33358.1 MAG: hypothetical protein C7B44_14745 [Sulfobacillus thermosulfidooxidans]
MPKDNPTPIWEETLIVDPHQLERLRIFITQPDSRTHDVFAEQTFTINDTIALNWLVKHDLFEGVMMQVSLLDTADYRHLGGDDIIVSNPEDIFGDYRVRWRHAEYLLHVKPA